MSLPTSTSSAENESSVLEHCLHAQYLPFTQGKQLGVGEFD